MATPRLRFDRISGHSFLPALVPADGIVVDLGANRGTFCTTVRRKYGWRCYAVEPNLAVWEQIPVDERLSKYNLAIAGADGPLTIHIGGNSESSSILDAGSQNAIAAVEVEGMTYSSFVTRHDIVQVDLLKVDIEGAEIPLFASMSDNELTRLGQVCVEFHELSGLSTIDAMEQLIKRFKRLGFAVFKMSLTHYADMLFVNRQLPGVTSYGLWRTKVFERSRFLAKRVIDRWTHREGAGL